MGNAIFSVPPPKNEPVKEYRPNSKETLSLKEALSKMAATQIDIPLIINGKEVRTGKTKPVVIPHDHQHKLGIVHMAGKEEIKQAIEGTVRAQKEWAQIPHSQRTAIFLKAAELLATEFRDTLNASTMLGQSKTCYQAEIDSACELIDFYRFNAHFLEQIYQMQPQSAPGTWNQLEYRPLEGFVFAVTPFNFTSIAGNLPTSPAIMGNVVLWKPATTAVHSGYYLMKLLEAAGLPPGVIQFVPGGGQEMGDLVFSHPEFAGIHFTGSTSTFNQMWKKVGENIGKYRGYPRIVGETGGKDFVFAHPSSEVTSLAVALVRGAFEYQGQKCSAASRAYVPKSLWPQLKERLVAEVSELKMGDVRDFSNFMSAVIDQASFNNIKGYLDEAKKAPGVKILTGGKCDDSEGYFVSPTILEVEDPNYRTMCEEIFGPVLSIYVYEDSKYEETLKLCDSTSPFALTGAFFATDRKAVTHATEVLRQSAGNFYINNKPTGAVVGQQPFGGARASGTNDKAGSLFNLLRWVSVRTISETFVSPKSVRYPFMGNE
jgi:1-pyrroline-5-carboxylate dehydrogenase